jgi:hypothetical protein
VREVRNKRCYFKNLLKMFKRSKVGVNYWGLFRLDVGKLFLRLGIFASMLIIEIRIVYLLELTLRIRIHGVELIKIGIFISRRMLCLLSKH